MLGLPFATRFPKPLSLTQFLLSNRKKNSPTRIQVSRSPPPMDPSDTQTPAQARHNGPFAHQGPPAHHQNVVVMRHGDRLDNFEHLWVSKAARPWDPPLFESGLIRAFSTGQKLRNNLGFPIHRVFVSPFLRCVQTACEVISGLFAVTGGSVPIDASKIKVSIEYGLCEMLNNEAIRPVSAPRDGDFGFNVSELEGLFPDGTVDRSVEPVYKELPKWPEQVNASRNRYVHVIKALADKYPNENLLLVTHGEGVGVAVSTFMEGVTVYEVDYCAHALLKRPVFYRDESYSRGEFQVPQKGLSGVRYLHIDSTTDVVEVPE
ncbi:Histidine phosphatase [Trema orientale]|uniref:Histidine phosphatase n=1 Tax=Trema orientale TaxID=63057 RepID=A0A2P5DAB5_TREOI|nr:Histidine phosphatase [Trema orientale]